MRFPKSLSVRKPLSTLLFCFVLFAVRGQNAKPPAAAPPPHPFVYPTLCAVDSNTALSPKGFRNQLDKAYSSVATGQSSPSLTDFGSLDPVAGTFTLNLYRKLQFGGKLPVAKAASGSCAPVDNVRKPGHVWYLNVGATGSIIGDNTGVLFDNSKFNSGLTVTGKLHIPLDGNSIVIGGGDADTIIQRKFQLEAQRQAEKKKVWNSLQVPRVELYLAGLHLKTAKDSFAVIALQKKYHDCDSIFKHAQAELSQISSGNRPADFAKDSALTSRAATLADSLQHLRQQLDDADIAKNTVAAEIDSVSRILQVLNFDVSNGATPLDDRNASMANYGHQLYTVIDEKYDTLVNTLEYKLPVQPYLLHWIAVIAAFNRNDYYTYYDSLPFSQRLNGVTYSSWSYGAEYNMLHSGLKTLSYLNVGALYTRNNNIADLNTHSLNKSVKTSLVDTTLNLSKDYKVYTDSIAEYKAFKLYANYYFYFNRVATQAIHFTGDVEFRDTHKSPLNLGVGYIFSFKNSKDNSVVNVEAYVKFIDVFKALPDQKAKFYNRNQVGLKFGIPFNLPTSN